MHKGEIQMNIDRILLLLSLILMIATSFLPLSNEISVTGVGTSFDTSLMNREMMKPSFWTYERAFDKTYATNGIDNALVHVNNPPDSFDLRDVEGKNLVTSVKFQSGGTCWAHAVCACMEGNLLMTGNWNDRNESDEPNLAEYHLDWWNGFNSFFNDDVPGSDGLVPHNGAHCRIAAAYLSRGEGAIFSEDANDEGERDANWFNTAPNRFDEHYDLYYPNHIEIYDVGETLQNIDLIKNQIMQYGPMINLFRADTNFLNKDFVHYQSSNSQELPNHNVVIIGWDDHKKTQAPKPGAWLCKNSWGSSWGLDGYFWISYFDKYCSHDYDGNEWTASFRDVEPMSYKRIYYHDYHGWQEDFTISDEAFNAFTAEDDEVLTAVSFFTCTHNVEYQIKIFDRYEDGFLLDEVSQCRGTMDFKGFHTVELDQPVMLKKHDDFFIYLSLSDGGIPYDRSTDVWGFYVLSKANPKESYYSNDGTWIDLHSYDPSANFCIKGLISKVSDLECDGSIHLGRIKPGSTIHTSVTVSNIGERFSKLHWKIIDHPDWGTWSFSLSEGLLYPESGPIILNVTITVPIEKNTDYTGKIKVVNSNNPNDIETVDITLSTAMKHRSMTIFHHLSDGHPGIFFLLDNV